MKTLLLILILNNPPVVTSVERYYQWTTWPIMWNGITYMQMRPKDKGVETNIIN